MLNFKEDFSMDIYQHLDPYLALQTYYQNRKKYEPAFSYTVWSEELGLKSSSTLRMMVNGKKRLSAGVAERIALRLFRGPEEQNYFRLLLVYAHAPTATERNAAWGALSKILSAQIEQKEALDYFTYISDLLGPKIMTLLTFEDCLWSRQKIGEALNVPPEKVQECLERLEKSAFVVSQKSSEGQVFWKATQSQILVSDKLGDLALRAYHDACMDEAKEAQLLPTDLRRYKSLLLPLNQNEFADLEQEVRTFTKQLISKYRADQGQGRRLYKLNLNFFAVSEALSAEKV